MADLVKSPDRPHIYVIVDGRRRWIPNEHTFRYLGYSFDAVSVRPQNEVDAIPEGEQLPEFPDTSLIAFAIPTDWPDPGIPIPRDHTFVISRNGDRWGCFGRSDPTAFGARIIAAGNGSISKANCIASGGNAGLVQGITGACHQAANRILFPSGATVHQAHGYVASVAVYGAYGNVVPEWDILRIRCCGLDGGIPMPFPLPFPIPLPPIPPIPPLPRPPWFGLVENGDALHDRENAFADAINDLSHAEQSDDLWFDETLKQTLVLRTGNHDQQTFDALKVMHHQIQPILANAVSSDRSKSVAEIHTTLISAFSGILKDLGKDKYDILFDSLSPQELATLLVPKDE